MQLLNPFDGNVVEISKDMPVTGVQRLEARTPDGRYVSHANKATVVHYRMRQHPRSQLVRITRRGGRSGARGSEVGKSLSGAGTAALRVGRELADTRVARATTRAGRQFRSGFADQMRARGSALMRETSVAGRLGSVAGAASTPIGAAGAAAPAYAAGRHRGKKSVGKRYQRDVFGKSSADRTVHADRRGTNALLPEGARRGRKMTDQDVSKGLGSALMRLGRGTDKAVARGLSMVADAPKPTRVPRSAPTGNLRRRLAGVPGPAGGSELARRLQQD